MGGRGPRFSIDFNDLSRGETKDDPTASRGFPATSVSPNELAAIAVSSFDEALATYDGQQLIGFMLLDAGNFHAFDPHEVYIGVFVDRSLAVRAMMARSCS